MPEGNRKDLQLNVQDSRPKGKVLTPHEEAEERHRQFQTLAKRLLVFVGVVLVAVLVVSLVVYFCYSGQAVGIAAWGAFGDSMAPVAAIGVVAALVLSAIGNYLQSQDVLAQLKEVEESQKIQEEIRDAQKDATSVQRESNTIERQRVEKELTDWELGRVEAMDDQLRSRARRARDLVSHVNVLIERHPPAGKTEAEHALGVAREMLVAASAAYEQFREVYVEEWRSLAICPAEYAIRASRLGSNHAEERTRLASANLQLEQGEQDIASIGEKVGMAFSRERF